METIEFFCKRNVLFSIGEIVQVPVYIENEEVIVKVKITDIKIEYSHVSGTFDVFYSYLYSYGSGETTGIIHESVLRTYNEVSNNKESEDLKQLIKELNDKLDELNSRLEQDFNIKLYSV